MLYPRSEKDMLHLLKQADEKGHLLLTIQEEFVRHPFSMPVLWGCRTYFLKLNTQDCINNPVLLTHLALLAAMDGKLDRAKEYVDLIGDVRDGWERGDFGPREEYRLKTELIMPYISDAMFLRIAFSLKRKMICVVCLWR